MRSGNHTPILLWSHVLYCAYYLIDLELTFTCTLLCPWDGQSIDTPLVEDGRSKIVTEDNKV